MRRDSIPVGGAIVALVDSLGLEPVRALSDSSGRFDLRAPRSGTYRLRVDAVGFARVISVPFELAPQERRAQRIHLVAATQRLTSLEIRARSRCDVKPAEGTQVALLWTEAQKSLQASLLSAGRGPLLAYDQDLIDYDSAFRRVKASTRTSLAARADEGYSSASPRALRDLGYAQRLAGANVYFGPDARVLLSDDFAATHCFNIEDRDPTSGRRVGLRFSPIEAPKRGYIGITGVLWLDRESFSLDRVEFTYRPRQSDDHPDSTFGGTARFARLANGQVIISRWELRTPVFLSVIEMSTRVPTGNARASNERERLVGVRVARGTTRAVSDDPSPLPVVNASLRRGDPPPDCDGFVADPARSDLPGTVMDRAARGVTGVRVRASWTLLLADGAPAREQWAESGADAQGRFVLCALPRGVELTVVARSDRVTSTPTVLTLGAAPPTPLVLGVR